MQDHWGKKKLYFCLLLYFDKKRTLFFYLLDFILLNMVKMGIDIVTKCLCLHCTLHSYFNLSLLSFKFG